MRNEERHNWVSLTRPAPKSRLEFLLRGLLVWRDEDEAPFSLGPIEIPERANANDRVLFARFNREASMRLAAFRDSVIKDFLKTWAPRKGTLDSPECQAWLNFVFSAHRSSLNADEHRRSEKQRRLARSRTEDASYPRELCQEAIVAAASLRSDLSQRSLARWLNEGSKTRGITDDHISRAIKRARTRWDEFGPVKGVDAVSLAAERAVELKRRLRILLYMEAEARKHSRLRHLTGAALFEVIDNEYGFAIVLEKAERAFPPSAA